MLTDLGGSSTIQEAMLMDLRKLPVMFFFFGGGGGGSMKDTRDTQDLIYKILMDVAYYIYIFLGILWILDIVYDVGNWILWNLNLPSCFVVGSFIFDFTSVSYHGVPAGMRSRDIFGRLRLRLRLRGSNPASASAPSKTVLRLRLRAKCTGSGGSGSGPGSDDQVLIWPNQQYDFQKCQRSKYDFLLTWPWVWMLLWMSVFEICHSLSSKATGWHSRGHRLLRVALSEISGLGPKWSFATDAQRILNIRRRISPRWHFWSVEWPNLIKDLLDVQIIKMHVSGIEENFK